MSSFIYRGCQSCSVPFCRDGVSLYSALLGGKCTLLTGPRCPSESSPTVSLLSELLSICLTSLAWFISSSGQLSAVTKQREKVRDLAKLFGAFVLKAWERKGGRSTKEKFNLSQRICFYGSQISYMYIINK